MQIRRLAKVFMTLKLAILPQTVIDFLYRITQVFISYGKKSNGELLLSYGFVPKEGTNPSDSVELSLSLKESDESYKEKLELLKKYGLSG